MNKSKKSFLEVAVVIGFAIALCIIAIIVISIVGGKSGKNKNIPLLCAEPAYPETIQAKDGEYVRKLSTYWWVVDVKNGKVILHDQNKIKEGFNIDKSCGVADFRGRITVPCEFTEAYFTSNGYIMAGNLKNISFFNMGGNCLETFDGGYSQLPQEAKDEYGEMTTNSADSAHNSPENDAYAVNDNINGYVQYYGKYITVREKEGFNKKEKVNTCVYEFKAKKE